MMQFKNQHLATTTVIMFQANVRINGYKTSRGKFDEK